MSRQAVGRFLRAARRYHAIRGRMEEVGAAAGADDAVERIVAIAAAAGYEFTAQEFRDEVDRRLERLSTRHSRA